MSPEERQIMIQISRLVEENNKILRKMRRAALWGRLTHILYWAVIVGASIGTFYYIQPYVEQLQGAYENASALLQNIGKQE
jgi:predicted MFS family arabinose efflux permease